MLRLVPSRPRGRTVASCLFVVALAAVGDAAPVVAALPFVAAARAARASEGPGFLLPAGARLPLLAQETTVDVVGPVARVRVTQHWRNDGDAAIDATYTIPASTGAAVHDLTLTVGRRVVRADLQEKKQAQRTFQAAREAGHTAGLLDEVRSNVLRLALANLRPHEEVVVRIDESLTLDRNDGVWELSLPQTTGPRYGDGVPVANVAATPTTMAALPVTSVDVRVSEPLPVRALGSTTHAITASFDGDKFARARIVSSAEDPVADRDFVLRFTLAGDDVDGGVQAYRAGDASDDGTFLFMAEPPEQLSATDSAPREVIFIVDVSGSMGGAPLSTASGLLQDLVGELKPRDRFNVLFFAGGSWTLSPESVPATQPNIDAAKQAFASLRGGGGTELLPALRTALQTPRAHDDDGAFARSFVVVTDGYVTVEKEAARLVRDHLNDATLFAFGIGSSVNRALIESLASAGHTSPVVVTDPSEAPAAVDRFVRDARPALTDVVLDTSRAPGFAAFDVEPAGSDTDDVDGLRLPDLYAGRALAVLGRFHGVPSGTLVLRGRTADGSWEREIDLNDVDTTAAAGEVLDKLWARRRVQRLAELADDDDKTNAAILALGLQHRLLTSQTSFVVVDSDARGAVATTSIEQPSLLPTGMDTANLAGLVGVGAGGGGLGLKGFGGSSTGYDAGGGGGSLSGDRDVATTQGVPVVLGSMHPEIIRRIVREHVAAIRSCYEPALKRAPGLAGKVVVKWVIDNEGRVVQAKTHESTLKSADVEGCLNKKIATWRFPRPKGGGMVIVNFPFVFRPGP